MLDGEEAGEGEETRAGEQRAVTRPKSICVSPFQGNCANLSTVAISRARARRWPGCVQSTFRPPFQLSSASRRREHIDRLFFDWTPKQPEAEPTSVVYLERWPPDPYRTCSP